jgi:hypothetical protein
LQYYIKFFLKRLSKLSLFYIWKLNVLIITPAPTETAPQFTNDLFNKFKDFDKFKIHHIEGSKMIDNIEITDNNIFVMSKQLLQKYINDKTIIKIKNLKLDIIGFDENVAFNNFNSKIEQQIGRYDMPEEMRKLYEENIQLLKEKITHLETEITRMKSTNILNHNTK